MSEVYASEIVGHADLESFSAEELDGAAIVDAFLVFRYQHPDWDVPRAAYVGSRNMTDELRIGLIAMVSDRIRSVAVSRWVEDDD